MHPVCERTCAASMLATASSAAFMLATAFLACRTRTNGRIAKPGEGVPPTQILGVRKGRKKPLATMGASNAHRNLVRAMGPECRCAVPNATATRIGEQRACNAWSMKSTLAARRKPQRSAQLPECALVLARAFLHASMRVHVGAYTTLPPDHIGGQSKGGSHSTNSCPRSRSFRTPPAGRSCVALTNRSAACCTLPPDLPSASEIADGGNDGKISESSASACTCEDSQSRATERAKPHSSGALASKRRVPSLVGNGPYRLVLRRRRQLQRCDVCRN
jgi:hypothetical protein